MLALSPLPPLTSSLTEGVQLHHHHHVDPVQYEIVQFKDGEEEEEEEEGAFDREWEAQRVSEDGDRGSS